jgi:hypothetical protein
LFLDEANNPEAIFTILHNTTHAESEETGRCMIIFKHPGQMLGLRKSGPPYLEMVEI